ncbi:MAG TPA: methyltransferase domain-containing protein [Solirubrobacteraceae bacterium]|nr:methyltransferase domain-containing protein [Solirubrobacteraceae bacterium]
MTSVSNERWQDAQEPERGFWSPGAFGLRKFRRTVVGSMQTAEWARPHLQVPAGDWLEVGIGPLGVGCAHFLQGEGELHTLDPIEPTPADEWRLPEPCRALVRACQEMAIRHVGQAEQIDFPDDAFALVAMENMLDHVEDPGAVLAEARRVLMPGGCLILAVDTFSTLGEARFRLSARRKLRDTTFVRAHPHRFSGEDVMRIVADAGFRVVHADTPGRLTAAFGRHYRTCLVAV